MATWAPLRSRLAEVQDQVTISWDDLDNLVGGLPPSAYDYPAFWSGQRSGWAGFRAIDVRVGDQVTFVRRTPATQRVAANHGPTTRPVGIADLILLGCVKSKQDQPAPAKDLYTSALFQKERTYAEASGKPWFILSAKHGLVGPDEVIEPYDVYLKGMPAPYREWWGRTVLDQLTRVVGPLRGLTIEIHASSAYVQQVASRMAAAGAVVVAPLEGLTMGQRLAWYRRGVPGVANGYDDEPVAGSSSRLPSLREAADVLERLQLAETALSPAELVATGGQGLRQPGMYSWWVDGAGAATLSGGLGHRLEPGLIYAGLAGATHTKSGKESSNTLWGRISGMHLGGRHEFDIPAKPGLDPRQGASVAAD